jgi:enoyl-CoA hydratase
MGVVQRGGTTVSEVQYEVRADAHVAVVTIDRPGARNAISPEVARGLEDAVDRSEQDDDVRVVILTGTPPVFCAGADLKAVGEGRGAELSTERGGFGGLTRRERTIPWVAAVDGPALAGGTELVLACDLVVASTSARFGVPEVKRGLVAAAGGLFRLGRRVPQNIALEAILTGDPFSAEDAHRHGLVNVLCAPGEALDRALELAARITVNAPLAVRESRAVALAATPAEDDEAWALSDRAATIVEASDDLQEGVRAFVEKRAPVWTGR